MVKDLLTRVMILHDALVLTGCELLGSLLLVLLHRLIAQFFPRPPAGVYQRMFLAQQPPSEEQGDGMAAVYSLDSALMDAELERPGSTFWIYYRQPMAIIARWLGSLLVSFPIAAWILGTGAFSCGSLLALLLGLGFSFYPYMTWRSSRPRLKDG
jgi:hypothetical protein